MLRSSGAIVLGYVVILMLSNLTLTILRFAFPGSFSITGSPEVGAAVVLAMSGFLYGMIGGYVTALIARRQQMAHALALAAIVAILWLGAALVIPMEGFGFQAIRIVAIFAGVLVGGLYYEHRRTTVEML